MVSALTRVQMQIHNSQNRNSSTMHTGERRQFWLHGKTKMHSIGYGRHPSTERRKSKGNKGFDAQRNVSVYTIQRYLCDHQMGSYALRRRLIANKANNLTDNIPLNTYLKKIKFHSIECLAQACELWTHTHSDITIASTWLYALTWTCISLRLEGFFVCSLISTVSSVAPFSPTHSLSWASWFKI